MAKKKPYWVRSLLKLKPRFRKMEEELKKQRTDTNKPVNHPTKLWKFDWHFSWKPSASTRLIVIILSEFFTDQGI